MSEYRSRIRRWFRRFRRAAGMEMRKAWMRVAWGKPGAFVLCFVGAYVIAQLTLGYKQLGFFTLAVIGFYGVGFVYLTYRPLLGWYKQFDYHQKLGFYLGTAGAFVALIALCIVFDKAPPLLFDVWVFIGTSALLLFATAEAWEVAEKLRRDKEEAARIQAEIDATPPPPKEKTASEILQEQIDAMMKANKQ